LPHSLRTQIADGEHKGSWEWLNFGLEPWESGESRYLGATVAAIASRNWNWLAPYVLGATSGALVLFIAFVAEPAAEALKPIPPLAQVIEAQRAPGAIVAARSVAGTYALIFYTEPGVVTVDASDADFTAAICRTPDLYLVTRAADVPRLVQLAATQGRRSTALARRDGVMLVHVDGPACAEGSHGST